MRLSDVSVVYRTRNAIVGEHVAALSDVSLTITRGEKVGLIGSNGAGKSTLLRVMAGVIRPQQGHYDADGMTSALLSLSAGFDHDLTGVRNIIMHGMLMGLSRKEAAARVPTVTELSGLGNAINRRVSTYSTGMRARLCFWTAINLRPHLMLVDEVMSVGDLEFRRKSQAAMMGLMQGASSVVLASHNLAFVERLCDRVIWLHQGRVQADGDADNVISAYQDSVRPRQQQPSPARTQRQLFVCGTGRSGTTALALLLNTNADIVVGIERYGKRLLRATQPNEYHNLFSKDRYFRYDASDNDTDTNANYASETQRSIRKFNTAVYVGDKVPRLYHRLKFLNAAFPDCRVIYIVRNPLFVAASWQVRAENSADRWPESNGYSKAITEWNTSLRLALKARDVFGPRLIFLAYERTFGSKRWSVWRDLARELGVTPTASTRTKSFLNGASKKAVAKRELPKDLFSYVKAEANYEAYLRILSYAL